MDYILNIRKPIGWSSFDAVRWVKKRVKEKVGHAGTLDPFAEGVLLILIGEATKKTAELMAMEKEYVAHVKLGAKTDSLDITGNLISELPVPDVSINQIMLILDQFKGEIQQVPPHFSAIKIAGKRAYKFAREGKKIELKPRKVMIHRIDLLQSQNDLLKLKIECSKGTYIRTLVADFSEKLGTVGYLQSLKRTRIGQYCLESSIEMYQIDDYIRKHISKS